MRLLLQLFHILCTIFRNDEKELLATLDRLERENLDIISNLLDCRQADLKISRYTTFCRATKRNNVELKQRSVAICQENKLQSISQTCCTISR